MKASAAQCKRAGASGDRRQVLLICLLLALAVALVYGPVRQFQFLNYDDQDYITENKFVRQRLTWEMVNWAFRHSYSSNWHPLTWISHALDWQLYGPNAGGHHLTNVMFHGLNTLLVFLVFKRLTEAVWRSAFVAALFALHPLHVESVAWISERKDVLSTFFGLLSIWAYARYGETSPVSSLRSNVQGPKAEVQGSISQLTIYHLPSSILVLLSPLTSALRVLPHVQAHVRNFAFSAAAAGLLAAAPL